VKSAQGDVTRRLGAGQSHFPRKESHVSATSSAASPGKEPAKSKKLIVIGAVVALLVIVAAALGLFLVNKQRHAADDDAQESKAAAVLVPTFLPMENMVVNLADTGGDRFAQIGITLELQDEKTSASVKQYMPSIRNGVLMLVSQRTAEELLRREGKEKLAADILAEVSRPLGVRPSAARVEHDADDGEEEERPRRRANPVRRVLFSSFIIQ
jgi:Flagellar basal body-associated protein